MTLVIMWSVLGQGVRQEAVGHRVRSQSSPTGGVEGEGGGMEWGALPPGWGCGGTGLEKSLPSLPITDPEPPAVFAESWEPGLLRGGTEWGGGKLLSLLWLSKPGRPKNASLLDLWRQHLVKSPP